LWTLTTIGQQAPQPIRRTATLARINIPMQRPTCDRYRGRQLRLSAAVARTVRIRFFSAVLVLTLRLLYQCYPHSIFSVPFAGDDFVLTHVLSSTWHCLKTALRCQGWEPVFQQANTSALAMPPTWLLNHRVPPRQRLGSTSRHDPMRVTTVPQRTCCRHGFTTA
jgi:hypothetical protein